MVSLILDKNFSWVLTTSVSETYQWKIASPDSGEEFVTDFSKFDEVSFPLPRLNELYTHYQ